MENTLYFPLICSTKTLVKKDLAYLKDVNFCKDHRNKIEEPDPLAVEDLISSKLNNKRKFARLITQYRDIFFSNISEGTAFLLQGVTEND